MAKTRVDVLTVTHEGTEYTVSREQLVAILKQVDELRERVKAHETFAGRDGERIKDLEQRVEMYDTLAGNLAGLVNGDAAKAIARVGDGPVEVLTKAFEKIEQLEKQLETCRKQFSSLEVALAHGKLPDHSPDTWREVGITFGQLAKASVDPARLAGLEVTVGGRDYLIGDVNPDGGQFGQTNQAFRRDDVVTRARVRVRR